MVTENFPTVTQTTHKSMTLPARPITYGVKVNTLNYTADSGFEQRRPKGSSKRTFDLTWPIISLEEYQTLRDFFIKVTNCVAFNWLDPVEKTTYVVRFDQDTFSAQQKYQAFAGKPYYELALKMVETRA